VDHSSLDTGDLIATLTTMARSASKPWF
jgi:hypothetical protein